ncbi:condensation domain-containing protein [Kribbella sp. NPDC050820]|uniref:condensation domain-containing protein n=1 Tax=Kribbella sp. NPDC050820 TaxID=3155408 RepID=UPI0033FE6779
MSWSQLYMWDWLSQVRPYDQQYNVRVELDTVSPVAVDDAVDLVAALVSRHETLRTRYYSGPDGTIMQETGGNGAFNISIAPQILSTDQVAATVNGRFDNFTGPQCHFTLILDGTDVRKILLTASHLALDGWSAGVLRQDFADLTCGRARKMPTDLKHPVDRAEWELSSQGQEANQEGLAHWRRTLARVPRTHFTRQMTSSLPRYRQVQVSSVAAGRAVRALAIQNRIPRAAVPLAAFSRAVRSVTGNDQNAFWIVTHNRFKGGFRKSVGCFFRDTVVCLEESPQPLLDTARKLLDSLHWANTNPRDVRQTLHNDDRASYLSVARSLYYNFEAHEFPSVADFPLDRLEWTDGKDSESQILYLNARLEGECLTMRLMTDTWCVPQGAAEEILQTCVQEVVQGMPPLPRAHQVDPAVTR